MIITKTPFRISFFGGGTDHPLWYRQNGGSVLSTAIDKYCYVTCRYLPPFFEHKHRVVYSLNELVNTIEEIRHPVVRECLKFFNFEQGLEIHYDGDLPARSGLGTSSSFVVGLLHALYGLRGEIIDKKKLAQEAIMIEQEKIKDIVGSQDQTIAAYGGFNRIDFLHNDDMIVTPMVLSHEKLHAFKSHLMLFFTGFTRLASDIEKNKLQNFPQKENELRDIQRMVNDAIKILYSNTIEDFGRLLDEAWQIKKSLAQGVSTDSIDMVYKKAKDSGALGGKILGAGGGGFLLLFAKPERKQEIRNSLSELLEIPFDFDNAGSQTIFYKPDVWTYPKTNYF